ncbi:putative phenylalanine--tRNA ligase [Helianthus debilis subsp. tardiflorus]
MLKAGSYCILSLYNLIVHNLVIFVKKHYFYKYSFWNFDALFQPQQHPARDSHDTYFLKGMLKVYICKPFEAKRYYSIDRVFRNVAVDQTHLAEFHQIEGLICDRGLSLGDLQGVLLDFFSCLGMSKLHFKPAYNLYTEPSMEIFGYNIVILVNNCNMETINVMYLI